MANRLVHRGRYLLLELLGAAVYGTVLYFTFTWLAGYSSLCAYFGNLALIILIIGLEELSTRYLESDLFLKKLSEQKTGAKIFRTNQVALEHSISFKTMLYLFYVFILIFSQVIDANPNLVSGNLADFIHSNTYSILLLIALDTLSSQVARERTRMKDLTTRVERFLGDNNGD